MYMYLYTEEILVQSNRINNYMLSNVYYITCRALQYWIALYHNVFYQNIVILLNIEYS